jgi:putative membrane protein
MVLLNGEWTLNIPVLLLVCILVAWHWMTNGNRLYRCSWYFFAGILLLLVVTMSPLNILAHRYYVFAHMIQHVVVLLIVPPLLLLGTPAVAMENVLKHPAVKSAAYVLFAPVLAWFLGIGTMWFWHIPAMFFAAVHSPAVHMVQMLTLLFLGIVFIWPVYAPLPFRKLSPLQAILYLFTACVGCTVLGIFISFSSDVLYAGAYAMATGTSMQQAGPGLSVLPFRLSPLEDQQIAGLIMWVPACVIYITNIMVILARWFRAWKEPDETQESRISGGHIIDNPNQQ